MEIEEDEEHAANENFGTSHLDSKSCLVYVALPISFHACTRSTTHISTVMY
jgi:hypothetical protein